MAITDLLGTTHAWLRAEPSLASYQIYPYQRIAVRPADAPQAYGAPDVAYITITREGTVETPLDQCSVTRTHAMRVEAYRRITAGGESEGALQAEVDTIARMPWYAVLPAGDEWSHVGGVSVESIGPRLLAESIPVHYALCRFHAEEITAIPQPAEVSGTVSDAQGLATWYADTIADILGIGDVTPYARILLRPGSDTATLLDSEGDLHMWHVTRQSMTSTLMVGGRLDDTYRMEAWGFRSVEYGGSSEAPFQAELETVSAVLRQPTTFLAVDMESTGTLQLGPIEYRRIGAGMVHACRIAWEVKRVSHV